MRTDTRGRMVILTALAVLGIGVTFAVADSLPLVGSRTVAPHGEPLPAVGGAADEADAATHDELGAEATSGERRSATERKRDGAKRRRGEVADEGRELQVAAALVPARGTERNLPLPCSDTNSCVDRVGDLITNVVDRVPDLPRLRECTSSIGGAATCFDFGAGNYLVGDAPTDGEAELGFCTDSGYYYVAGPHLGGGVGESCPDDPGAVDRHDGKAPRPHDCTSWNGGEATCFDFGDGSYIVSDPASDGEGELGFCTDSEYYYVSAPSAEGDAGAKCPDARAGD
jgi:hypothetical protein